jgi:hypothetical protein
MLVAQQARIGTKRCSFIGPGLDNSTSQVCVSSRIKALRSILRKIRSSVFLTFMPTISVFYGIVIQMFWRDHAPPHFHALYAEHEALIDLRDFRVIRGSLPRRAMALVLEWAADHRDELMEDWNLCSHLKTPRAIEPLK